MQCLCFDVSDLCILKYNLVYLSTKINCGLVFILMCSAMPVNYNVISCDLKTLRFFSYRSCNVVKMMTNKHTQLLLHSSKRKQHVVVLR